MRCRAARAAIVDAELGALGGERQAALSRHLAGCAVCRRESERGSRLLADLAGLRGKEFPREIDVAPRVLARLAALDAVRREDVPTIQLGWAALAAGVGAVLLVLTFFELLPDLSRLARGIGVAAAAIGGIAVRLLEPLGTLLAAPFRLLGSLLRSAAPYLDDLQPLAVGIVAACTAGMALTITLVLGRDLRRGQPLMMREDN